jgi:hypothetical protein
MAMADLSEHSKIKTVGTPFGVSYATLSSAEGFSTTMTIVRPDPIDWIKFSFSLHK